MTVTILAMWFQRLATDEEAILTGANLDISNKWKHLICVFRSFADHHQEDKFSRARIGHYFQDFFGLNLK